MSQQPAPKLGRRRRGLTLVELLAVSVILLMMAGTLGSLSLAVQNTNQYQFSRGLALQHGQVTLVRLQRHIQLATANHTFPGFVVFPTAVGANSFPDTLVIWHPVAAPADPKGLPRINELVVYCPNPEAPEELWEITQPSDTRVVPALTNTSAWQQELDTLRKSTVAQRVVLTDLLRLGRVRDSNGKTAQQRAVLRFETVRRPSAFQCAAGLSGSSSWESLPWVQGIHGRMTGLCQSRCRIEFQLRPGGTVDDRQDSAIPFFGSASVYFNLERP